MLFLFGETGRTDLNNLNATVRGTVALTRCRHGDIIWLSNRLGDYYGDYQIHEVYAVVFGLCIQSVLGVLFVVVREEWQYHVGYFLYYVLPLEPLVYTVVGYGHLLAPVKT